MNESAIIDARIDGIALLPLRQKSLQQLSLYFPSFCLHSNLYSLQVTVCLFLAFLSFSFSHFIISFSFTFSFSFSFPFSLCFSPLYLSFSLHLRFSFSFCFIIRRLLSLTVTFPNYAPFISSLKVGYLLLSFYYWDHLVYH